MDPWKDVLKVFLIAKVILKLIMKWKFERSSDALKKLIFFEYKTKKISNFLIFLLKDERWHKKNSRDAIVLSSNIFGTTAPKWRSHIRSQSEIDWNVETCFVSPRNIFQEYYRKKRYIRLKKKSRFIQISTLSI